MQTIEDCVQEYTKIVASEAASSPTTATVASKVGAIGHSSPCYNLRRQLVHSLADFGLDIASYQSPMKPSATLARAQSLQKHFPPVNIRNYIYVISPLPQSWLETTYFLDGKKPSDTNLLGPRKADILDVLKGIKDTFFEQQLWDRFLDQRTSLSWIDTNPKNDDASSAKVRTYHNRTFVLANRKALIRDADCSMNFSPVTVTDKGLSNTAHSFDSGIDHAGFWWPHHSSNRPLRSRGIKGYLLVCHHFSDLPVFADQSWFGRDHEQGELASNSIYAQRPFPGSTPGQGDVVWRTLVYRYATV